MTWPTVPHVGHRWRHGSLTLRVQLWPVMLSSKQVRDLLNWPWPLPKWPVILTVLHAHHRSNEMTLCIKQKLKLFIHTTTRRPNISLRVVAGASPFWTRSVTHLLALLRSSPRTPFLAANRYKQKQYGFHSFAHYGLHIWNDILPAFKNKLKTCLVSQHYRWNQILVQRARACVRACVCYCYYFWPALSIPDGDFCMNMFFPCFCFLVIVNVLQWKTHTQKKRILLLIIIMEVEIILKQYSAVTVLS